MHRGTLAGTGMLTSAVISMLQYPLFTAAIDGNIDGVNAGCAAVVGACVPYTVWLSMREAGGRVYSHTHTLSLNSRLDRGKYVLFIGCER